MCTKQALAKAWESVICAAVSNSLHPLTSTIKAVNDLCLALIMFSCICYSLQPFLGALWGKIWKIETADLVPRV